MEKTVNIPGLRRLPFCLHGWHLGARHSEGSLDDRGGYSAWTVCANSVVDAKHPLSFWEPGILVLAMESVPT